MKAFYTRFRTFILYFIFGIGTTLVNLLVFFLLKRNGMTDTDLGYTLASAISWVAAVLFAFVTNKIWVFQSKTTKLREVVGEACKFVGGRMFSGIFEIILPTFVAHILGEGISFNVFGFDIVLDSQWEAKIVVTVLVILINYLVSKWFVFKK